MLNLEHIGSPIAVINTTRSKKHCILSVDDKHDARQSFPFIHLDGQDSFQQIPDQSKERQILYITGQSGSGKSYYTKQYADIYTKMYPKRDVFLCSSINEDSSIDEIKGLKRMKLTDALLEDDLKAEDFANSLVILDDCDCITDKRMRQKVAGITSSILETGRHFNVSCIVTSHIACGGNDTKRILNETNSITLFPKNMGGRSLKYLLESYLGLSKEQIKKIKKLDSRWVTVCKTYPMVVLSEHDSYIVCHDD